MLDELLTRDEIQHRLISIFPEGTPFRNYCTRDMAAATVFTMLYIGAIDGSGRFLGPKHVYKMGAEQAALTTESERVAYGAECMKGGFVARPGRWYADNTRESIRDETLRQGLIPIGAVLERTDLATTSPAPRYTLTNDFARLFAPSLRGSELQEEIESWREVNLSKASLARIKVVKSGRTKNKSRVGVTLPSGETRQLKPGKSSIITKRVVEDFAPRFLEEPAVIWISESGKKVVAKDDELSRLIGLDIDPARNLPDVILADVARDEIVVIFVEVVATDGPIHEERRTKLLELAHAAGLPDSRVGFVTAYMERSNGVLKRNLPDLAWNSFVWLASEPENIIALLGGAQGAPSIKSLLLHSSHLRAVK